MSIQSHKPISQAWQELVRQLGEETNPERTAQLAKEVCRVMDAEREKQKQLLLSRNGRR